MIETNNHIFFWCILGLMTQKYAVFILLLALMPLAQCQQSQHDMPIQAYDEETLQALDKAIQSNPRNAQIWYDKSTVLAVLGRTNEAKDAYLKAKELGWDDLEPRSNYYLEPHSKPFAKQLSVKSPVSILSVVSPAGKHSCLIGTSGINEFVINWTDSKNYTDLEKHVYDGTVSFVGSSETWLETTFELAAYTNENITLGFEIDWHPGKKEPSNVQDIELDPELTATQSEITIQGKKALLVKNKERKVYQGTDESPSITQASFFVCYYPDDYTKVVIRAPAGEWKDSEFKAAVSSLKVIPPAGYY
jgi:tetratricopeptide (TPR) repeat protein